MTELTSEGRATGIKVEAIRRALDADKIYEVWIAAGQSNMAGAAAIDLSASGVDRPVGSEVWILDEGGLPIPYTYPLHRDAGTEAEGSTLAYHFAKLKSAGGAHVIMCGAAEGATGLNVAANEWIGPAAHGGSGSGGVNYQQVVTRMNALIASGANVVLKGVIWHQGESDAGASISTAQHKTDFLSMINGWKAEINDDFLGGHDSMAVVIGQLAQQLLTIGFNQTSPPAFIPASQYQAIDLAHKELVEENRGFAFAPSTGLTLIDQGTPGTDDDIHFDSDSNLEFANRFHAASIEAHLNQSGSARGINKNIDVWGATIVYPEGSVIYYTPEKRIKKANTLTGPGFTDADWDDLSQATSGVVSSALTHGGDKRSLGTNLGLWLTSEVQPYAYKNLAKAFEPWTISAGSPTFNSNGFPNLSGSDAVQTLLFDRLGSAGTESDSTEDGAASYLANFVPLPIYRSGTYIVEVTFAGLHAGFALTVGGDASLPVKTQTASVANGLKDIWEFSVTTPGTGLTLTFTAPGEIVDIACYHEADTALVESQPWNEDFIKELQTFDVIRSSAAQNATGIGGYGAANIDGFSTRPSADYYTWVERGVPLEILCDLCNTTGCDLWYSIPYKVYEDSNFAEADWNTINEFLARELICYVEYSHEAWTQGTTQGDYIKNTVAPALSFPATQTGQHQAIAEASQVYWELLETFAGSLSELLARTYRVYPSDAENTTATDEILGHTLLNGSKAGRPARTVCDRLSLRASFPRNRFDPATHTSLGVGDSVDLSKFGSAVTTFGYATTVPLWLFSVLVDNATASAPLKTANQIDLADEAADVAADIATHQTYIDANYPGIQVITHHGGCGWETNTDYDYNSGDFADTSQIEALLTVTGDPRFNALVENLIRDFYSETNGGLFCLAGSYGTPGDATPALPASFKGFLRFWGDSVRPTPPSIFRFENTSLLAALRVHSETEPVDDFRYGIDPEVSSDFPEGLKVGQILESASEGVINGVRYYPGQLIRTTLPSPTNADVLTFEQLYLGQDYLSYFIKQFEHTALGASNEQRQQMSIGKVDALDSGTPNSPIPLSGNELYGIFFQNNDTPDNTNGRFFIGKDNAVATVGGITAYSNICSFQVINTVANAQVFCSVNPSNVPSIDALALTSAIANKFGGFTLRADQLGIGVTKTDSGANLVMGMQVNRSGNDLTKLRGDEGTLIICRDEAPVSEVPGNTTALSGVLRLTKTNTDLLRLYHNSAGADDVTAANRVFSVFHDGTRWVFEMPREDGTFKKVYINNSDALVVV